MVKVLSGKCQVKEGKARNFTKQNEIHRKMG
jgi:hypothetical protein